MARPRGFLLNPIAFRALLTVLCTSRGAIAQGAGMSAGHLSDLEARRRGASADVAQRLSLALGVEPGALFPEIAGFRPPVAAEALAS